MNIIENHVWGFDMGKGSLGEAVRIGDEFKHVQSLIIDKDFAEIKTAAGLRRQMRTRKAHHAREKWLEKCLADCGIEILKRRKVDIVDGKWALVSKGDSRLEREFPAYGENVCYNSIALRCKLLLGEKLESWQVFKALNSAIQNRGYDEKLPWKEGDTTKKKDDDSDYAEKLKMYEREKDEMLLNLPDLNERSDFDYPCFFKAFKIGIWSPENPRKVELRITNQAQKAKGYVIPRKCVEEEFVRLVEMASLQYPKLKGKAMFILYGISETPYASLYEPLRKKFNLKRGAETDWTALGQKIPRFDNRIIDKCKLIPRLNVCKIKPLNEAKADEDFLHYDITLALKLLNLRFFRNSSIESLCFEDFKKLFEIGRKNKYKISKTNLKKFFKSINAEVLSEDQSQIEAPRTSGRASFSRPAMKILRELIFSGKTPAEFYEEKLAEISNTDHSKGLIAGDLDFIKLMGDCPWGGIFIPDVETYNYARQIDASADERINKLIGEQNDPIVRHRLSFFYERLKSLSQEFGTPDKIVLEFVREDFMGEKAKKEMNKAIKERFAEKLDLAKKLDESGYKGNKMLLKLELLQKQGGQCIYTGLPLQTSDLPNLEIEHIVPRSRGGPDAQYNYALTTESINKQKADRTPFEWLSADKAKWQEYCARVRSRAKELGKKRCELLLKENAEELVEKYTALAETAWISKLAQRIACMFFGFQFGGNSGTKRVFTVSGNTTSRIRGTFGLNRILHSDDSDRENMSEFDFVKLSKKLEEKNRENKKHHALDAMCLCFAPTARDVKKVDFKTLLPKKIAESATEYFKSYLDKIVPNEVAPKKPRLEDSIYSLRKIQGKNCIVKKFNLVDLAKKKVNQKSVYDLNAIAKLLEEKPKKVPPIINPVIRKLIKDFVATNPSEQEWKDWCENLRIPSKNGEGSRVIRVLKYVGEPDEYKDLSKDGCGAYRKGDNHKGQIIWQTKGGKYKVAPIYVHASKRRILEALKSNPDFEKVAGEFRIHCLVKLDKPAVNDKGEELIADGIYTLNTIKTAGKAILTNPNGIKAPEININYLMQAGMRRIKMDY